MPDPDTPLVSSRPDEVVVWRVGPEGQVWDLIPPAATTVASIWLDHSAAWHRAVWPHDLHGVPVAPVDLSVGHVLELCSRSQTSVATRYGCVLDIADDAIVAYATSAYDRALLAGEQIACAWRDAHLHDAWQRPGRLS